MDPILFVGRAPEQVDEFLEDEINPILENHKDLLKIENRDHVNV
jgi:adenylosuccinate lyase